MLRFVARVLIARQHDFCQTAVEAAIHSGVRITSEGRLRSPLPPIEAARLVRNLQTLNVFSAMALGLKGRENDWANPLFDTLSCKNGKQGLDGLGQTCPSTRKVGRRPSGY
jgi:hypothetical protein